MKPNNSYSLEKYAERHRADFDWHEPRPELWAALEQQLHGEAAPAEHPLTGVAPASAPRAAAAEPAPRERLPRRWQPYGLAAALALLMLAAGAGENWRSRRVAVAATPGADASPAAGPTAAVATANQSGNVDARLDTAVHGMERYYLAQLNNRKAQLGQLAPAATAEWARELVGLDSSYQQLKRELPQHPQPEVVLTAMNRNLQIRLDILDQQLERHGNDQLARTVGPAGDYVLADSRVILPDNLVVRHAR